MGKPVRFPLIILFIFFGNAFCLAQFSFDYSAPRVELIDGVVNVSYDILNFEKSDLFTVSIEFLDEEGNKINAVALYGDIGDGIVGGDNKKITWNLEADNIQMEGNISVKLHVVIPSAEEPVDRSNVPPPNEVIEKKEYSRSSIMLKSLVFPGYGLSQVSGKPHWIRGVAGYGCLTGSIILNRLAFNAYEGIDGLTSLEDKNNQYSRSVKQDNASEALAYAAIGIWVTDFIWNLVGTSNIQLNSTIDPLSYAPMIGFTYHF